MLERSSVKRQKRNFLDVDYIQKFFDGIVLVVRRKVLEYSPQLSSEWINLNFLDFLKLQLPSPLSPINGCADQTLDLSTVEIHVLLPPFVLTPNNVIELQHSVKAAGEAASNGTVNTTLFLWHDPRQCAKALSVPEFVNETDSFSMSFSTARVPLSHSLVRSIISYCITR